jgi:cation diffusion facilitator CzcD-associated flavoprotein CzcO
VSEHHEVLIVGAGISGVGAAIRLREAGVDDVLILEKADTFGGTWRANTYPGCACDVPSRLYSYSFAPNPDWSRVFAEQDEILGYVDRVARENGLADITRFGTELIHARWDDGHALWQVKTTMGELTARFLVCAAGPWNEPNVPDIPGLDEFTGEVFHSSRWNHDYDLAGKRVAVIGTGASAVQFVPEIAPLVESVDLFQRTPHWVLPKPDHAIPGIEKWSMRRIPGLRRSIRQVEYGAMETLGTAYHRPRPFMHAVQAVAKAYLRTAVRDSELREKLTPRYLIGCKRILFSNNWFATLQRPNVSVHASAVNKVVGSTVVGADGAEAEVDAIILGTGFHILDMPVAGLVHDAHGRSLADRWAGSPEAYLGSVVAGFPNAFILLGPSLGTGHTSAFVIAEAQIDYIVNAIQTARDRGWRWMQVRPEVQQAYVAQVQAALPGTAYNLSSCHSYYVDQNGRNSFSWPWSSGALVRRVSAFDPEVFEVAS